jgi:hypothetical protein
MSSTVMNPGLKHLGLMPGGTAVAPGTGLGFQKPVAFDTMTSQQGPRGTMKNGTLPPTRRCRTPYNRSQSPTSRRSAGFPGLSCFFGSRDGRGVPFRLSPDGHQRLGGSVPLPDRTFPWPPASCILWYHGRRLAVKSSGRAKALQRTLFPPSPKGAGLPPLKGRGQ